MASGSNISVSNRFSECKKVTSPKVIIARIRSLMANIMSHSQVYVDIKHESDEFWFELLPDMDSIEYDSVSDRIVFTTDRGEMISTISFGAAEIFYDLDRFEDGDEIYEFFHVVYSSGIVITIEILTLYN